MKKLIIITVLAASISLGFTIVNHTPGKKIESKYQNSEKMDFSHKLNEKRLANWD